MAFPDYGFAGCLSGLACLVLSAHSAAAVEGGVFCKGGGAFFAARPGPGGALTFRVLDSNAQGHVIEIGGGAVPHKGGWRYQVKSDNDPQQRCTLDITPVAGGFKMDTVEGARCAGMGGFNAQIVLMGESFPASTQVKGVAPVVDSAGNIPGFDCHHKKFETAQGAAPVKAEAPGSKDAPGQWSVGTDKNRVNAHGKAMDSEAIFYVACNTDHYGQKVSVSFGPYRGNALDNIDDTSRPMVLVISNQDGTAQKFPAEMHYYGPDSEWVLNDSSLLPPAFLEGFGRDELLTILNGRGGKVLEVPLSGAGKARETIRSVCHM